MDELTEKVARAIYDLFEYDSEHNPGFEKPEWFPSGNSFKQEEARDYAQAAIKAVLEELRSDLEAVTQIAHICRTMGEPWVTDNGWKAVTNLRKLMEELK